MLMMMYSYFAGLRNNEEGQGMVEYALLIGLIAVVVILVLTNLGGAIAAKFQEIVDNL